MIHHVYKTTLPDGRFYVGCSHRGLDTDYLGSGRMLKQYIKEYGREGITREIIREFEDREDASQYEKLCQDYYLTNEPEKCLFTKRSQRDWGSKESHPLYGKSGTWRGKKHSEKSKLKMSESSKGNTNRNPRDPNVTPQIVRGIRLLRNQKKPWTYKELAEAYGLTYSVAYNIAAGRTWQEVKG